MPYVIVALLFLLMLYVIGALLFSLFIRLVMNSSPKKTVAAKAATRQVDSIGANDSLQTVESPKMLKLASGFDWQVDPGDTISNIDQVKILTRQNGRHIVYGFPDYEIVAELHNEDGNHFIYLIAAAAGGDFVEIYYRPNSDGDGAIPLSFINLSKSEAGWYAQQFLLAMKDDRINKGWVNPDKLEHWINNELGKPQPAVPYRAMIVLTEELPLSRDQNEKAALPPGIYELKRRMTDQTGWALEIELDDGVGGEGFMDQAYFEEISQNGQLRILKITDKS